MKKKKVSISAFLNFRTVLALLLVSFGAVLSLYAAGALSGPAGSSGVKLSGPQVGGFPDPAAPISGVATRGGVLSVRSYKNDMSPPLREMAFASNATLQLGANCELKENPKTNVPHTDAPDAALQDAVNTLKTLEA